MKTAFNRHRPLLPLIVLLGLCIYNSVLANFPVLDGNTYAVLNYKHYLAEAAVVLNFIFYFGYRRIYKYTLLTTLLVGTFDIINFSLTESYFNIGSISIGFHITPILIGLFTMALYSDRFKKNAVDGSGTAFESISRDNTAAMNREKEEFKLKFRNRSSETLMELCNDERYSLLAKEAAKQILDERTKQ
jgi:hypothetical protein